VGCIWTVIEESGWNMFYGVFIEWWDWDYAWHAMGRVDIMSIFYLFPNDV
jgi:hypothetical protein